MKDSEHLIQENDALRERLSSLRKASLRINESLDFDTVLQGVLDSACSLTGARYGVITLHDSERQVKDFLASGMSAEEAEQMWDTPGGLTLFEYLGGITEPLRVPDLHEHSRSLGLPKLRASFLQKPPLSFLAAPVLYQGMRVGTIYVGEPDAGRAFTNEDEETLAMFAVQAALVISNARRYREEQQARSDMETLVNTSPVGVVVVDAKDGVPVSLNQEAKRIVSRLRIPDRSIENFLEVVTFRRADGREISLEEIPLAQALSEGETVRLEEIVMQVPDGSSVTVLINATPRMSEEGEVESFVVAMQDMTPLEEMERARAEFMGMVSHELWTPLSSIKGSATTLLEEAASLDPAEMRQFHRIISEQADGMRRLISDLLDVASIGTGMLSVATEPSEVTALVDEAKNTFLSAGRRHSIVIHITPGLPQVMADRRRVVQVLINLLSNAARYSSDSSTIWVNAVREEFHVAISVADEGRGIHAERLPFLFRKFPPIDSEERRSEPTRSGLGLAICKGIVEAHGGRIWAESDGPGQGACFTFTLPVVEREGIGRGAEPMLLAGRPEKAAEGQTRILAVDDDPNALRYVRNVLSTAGYDPIVTGDPEDVERLMEEEKPELVLLDLMLPGVDGIALMKKILESAEIPVIFLSVYGQENVIANALDMGAADYVVKPFSRTELVARIRAALRKQFRLALSTQPESYSQGDLTVNFVDRHVTKAGRRVMLTDTEYTLLMELAINAGRVLTHDQLLHRVWGDSRSGQTGLIRTVVKRLRHKLGDDAGNPRYLFTEPRVGYRMKR